MPFSLEEQYIQKAEAELGIKFPASFRNKMMQQNGGEVAVGEDCYFLHPFFDSSEKKRIKRTCNSIVHETQKARKHYRFADSLIIIGHNGGGDVLVFQINPDNKLDPTVYWLDHETEALVFAANDFGELQIDA